MSLARLSDIRALPTAAVSKRPSTDDEPEDQEEGDDQQQTPKEVSSFNDNEKKLIKISIGPSIAAKRETEEKERAEVQRRVIEVKERKAAASPTRRRLLHNSTNMGPITSSNNSCEEPATEEKTVLTTKAKPKSFIKLSTGNSAGNKSSSGTVTVNTAQCMYDVVEQCAEERGWKCVDKEENLNEPAQCSLYWIDKSTIQEHFKRLKRWQKINHIPGMPHLARKAKLSRTLKRMKKAFPDEYDFTPKTWVLPTDLPSFKDQFDQNGKSNNIFIIKPDAKCQGRGIYMVSDLNDVDLSQVCVAQKYLKNPLLISGFKFDLRVYLLVSSCYPLRVYIFNDGLVRMCTNPYTAPNAKNMDDRCMHLTNYAVNKKNDKFQYNTDAVRDDEGSKRSLRWFFRWLTKEYGQEESDKVWATIQDILLKAVIAVQPTLANEYAHYWQRQGSRANSTKTTTQNGADAEEREEEGNDEEPLESQMRTEQEADSSIEKGKGSEDVEDSGLSPWRSAAFAILGTDVIIDQSLNPILLEVNMLPSFNSDSPLDQDIKHRLISQALELVDISGEDERVFLEEEARRAKQRLYQTDKAATPPAADGASQKSVITKITEFFAKHHSSRKGEAQKLANKYRGREEELFTLLNTKYKKQMDTREVAEQFFFEFDRENSDKVDDLMEEYRDKEDDLITFLEEKFEAKVESIQNVKVRTVRSIEKLVEDSSSYFETLENEKLTDYIKIYPPSDPKQYYFYNKLLAYSNESADEERSRLLGGSQRRPSLDDSSSLSSSASGSSSFLPPIGRRGSGQKDGKWEWKPPAEPSQEQQAKLTRMMQGYSSKSAPASMEAGPNEMSLPKKQSQDRSQQDPASYGHAMRQRKEHSHRLPMLAVSKVNLGNDLFMGAFGASGLKK